MNRHVKGAALAVLSVVAVYAVGVGCAWVALRQWAGDPDA